MYTTDNVEGTLSLKEAAQFLGFKNTCRFREKLKSGEVPGFKIGRDWRCIKADLLDYIRNSYKKNEVILCNSKSLKRVNTGMYAVQSLSRIKTEKNTHSELMKLREKLKKKQRNNTNST